MAVNVIDTLKPKNNGDFPVVEAEDVAVGTVRLSEALNQKADKSELAQTNAALSGKANTAEVTAATNNLQAQINQIEIGASAEAVVAPEVTAARVDSEGVSHATLKARIDNTESMIADVETDLSDEVAGIVTKTYNDLDLTNTSTYDSTYNGYFSPGGFISDPAYRSYLLRLDKDTTIYCKSKNDSYLSICIYNTNEFTGGSRYRYNPSSSEDTLPYVGNPLSLSKEQYLTITVKVADGAFDFVLSNYYLLSKTLEEDVALDATQVTQITREITPYFAGTTSFSGDLELDNESTYERTYNGYFGPNGFTPDDAYISYLVHVDKYTSIYCESRNDTYFSICVYDTDEFTGGTRYRYKKNDSDNLPYEANPLSLSRGQYVLLTVSVFDTEFAVILPDYNSVQVLDANVRLDEAQIEQIKENTDIGECYIIYHDSDTGIFTEAVDIFTPTKVGYIRYHFAHGISVDANANIWRITNAYATDNQFNDRFTITTNGEWELALQPVGAPDFAGGTTHGDQVMTDITWFIDGKKVDITSITELTVFTRLKVIETSGLYNPSNPEIQMVQVTSEHIWDKEKLTINQALLWDTETEIQLLSAYMGMHLPAKAITDHFYTDASYAPLACLGNYAVYNNVKRAVIYGDTSGVSTEFWNTEYPTGYTGEGTFRFTDNNGGAYNKGYFVVTSGATIPIGQTLWKSSVHYKFEVGK